MAYATTPHPDACLGPITFQTGLDAAVFECQAETCGWMIGVDGLTLPAVVCQVVHGLEVDTCPTCTLGVDGAYRGGSRPRGGCYHHWHGMEGHPRG